MPHSPITAGTKVVYQEGVYTVRAVDGNVLELAYHTGDFFRLVHASSVLVCPSPATQTAASLPAPAAGQGEGTPPSPFAYVSFLRGEKLCRSNITEREIAELVAVHYRNQGFKGVQVVPA